MEMFEVELQQILAMKPQPGVNNGENDSESLKKLQIKSLKKLESKYPKNKFLVKSLIKNLQSKTIIKNLLPLKAELENFITDSLQNTTMAAMDEKQKKVKLILKELFDTEKLFVQEIGEIVKGYYSVALDWDTTSTTTGKQTTNNNNDNDSTTNQKLLMARLPLILSDENQKPDLHKINELFCNLPAILEFHKNDFLYKMDAAEGEGKEWSTDLSLISNCFLEKHMNLFTIYMEYCQLLHKNERALSSIESDPWFLHCKTKLGHSLSLSSYLLKPLQRITKYQLLLKDLSKNVNQCCDEFDLLEKALDSILMLLQCLNDHMCQIRIEGYIPSEESDGHLLLHTDFLSLKKNQILWKTRHLLLYQKCLIICSKKSPSNTTTKTTKAAAEENCLKLKGRFALNEIYLIDDWHKQNKFQLQFGNNIGLGSDSQDTSSTSAAAATKKKNLVYKFQCESKLKAVWVNALRKLLLESLLTE